MSLPLLPSTSMPSSPYTFPVNPVVLKFLNVLKTEKPIKKQLHSVTNRCLEDLTEIVQAAVIILQNVPRTYGVPLVKTVDIWYSDRLLSEPNATCPRYINSDEPQSLADFKMTPNFVPNQAMCMPPIRVLPVTPFVAMENISANRAINQPSNVFNPLNSFVATPKKTRNFCASPLKFNPLVKPTVRFQDVQDSITRQEKEPEIIDDTDC